MRTTREVAIYLKAVNQMDKGLSSGSSSIASFVRNVGNMFKWLVIAVGAAFTAMTTHAILTGAAFEQSMANTSSMFIATAESAEQLESWTRQLAQVARELGASTAFTATEAADAMYSLASGGLEAQEILAATESVLHLAGATMTGLAEAAELTMSTMRQFGLTADESSRIVNVFAAAIQNSMLNMERLHFAMQYTGPVAARLGMTLEGTAAALALLHNAGLKGSLAGTGMRQVMIRLTRPTKELAHVLEGTTVSADGFAKVLMQLRDANLRPDQVARMFGQRTLAAITSLLAAGETGFNKMKDKITDTTAAADAYARQMNTIRSQWIILISAMQEVRLKVFDVIKVDLMVAIKLMQRFVTHTGDNVANIYKKIKEWIPKAFDFMVLVIEESIRAIKIAWEALGPIRKLIGLQLELWALEFDIAMREMAVHVQRFVTWLPRTIVSGIEVTTKNMQGALAAFGLAWADAVNPGADQNQELIATMFAGIDKEIENIKYSYGDGAVEDMRKALGLGDGPLSLPWWAEFTKQRIAETLQEIAEIPETVRRPNLRLSLDDLLGPMPEFSAADFELDGFGSDFAYKLAPELDYIKDAWGGFIDDIESLYFDSWDIIWDTARTGSEKWKAIYASVFSSIGKMFLKLVMDEFFWEGMRTKWRELSAQATENSERKKQQAIMQTMAVQATAVAANTGAYGSQIGMSIAAAGAYYKEGQAAEKTAAQKFFAAHAGLPIIGWAMAAVAVVSMIAMLSKMHDGGMVGAMGSRREAVRTLQEGEYVMPVGPTQRFLPLLESMRSGNAPAFSAVGAGGGSGSTTIVANVNVGAGSLLLANDKLAVRRISTAVADDIDKRLNKRRVQ